MPLDIFPLVLECQITNHNLTFALFCSFIKEECCSVAIVLNKLGLNYPIQIRKFDILFKK